MARQNIYDNEIFFDGYKKLRGRKGNANDLFEIPALFSLLPPLEGKKILDLGCGTGTICNILSKKGYDCIGIDSSEHMLNVAYQKNVDNKTA